MQDTCLEETSHYKGNFDPSKIVVTNVIKKMGPTKCIDEFGKEQIHRKLRPRILPNIPVDHAGVCGCSEGVWSVVKDILVLACFMKKHIEERDNLMKIKINNKINISIGLVFTMDCFIFFF
jgi:hypothetical protein